MEFSAPENFGEYQLTYRSGDIVAPRLEVGRAARARAAGLRPRDPDGLAPRSHAELGLEIVLAMEAAEESLRRNGQPVEVTRAIERAAA